MRFPKPQFEISRVASDGSCEVLEVVPVTSLPLDSKMKRREMLGIGLTLPVVVVAMAGCGPKKSHSAPSVMKISVYDSSVGKYVERTLPCGSPIPPNATCVCNCVPVSTGCDSHCTCEAVCRCVGHCTCNQVCTCNPQQVCSCNQVCTCERVCTCVPQGFER